MIEWRMKKKKSLAAWIARTRHRFLFVIVDVPRIEASTSVKRVAFKKRNASTVMWPRRSVSLKENEKEDYRERSEPRLSRKTAEWKARSERRAGKDPIGNRAPCVYRRFTLLHDVRRRGMTEIYPFTRTIRCTIPQTIFQHESNEYLLLLEVSPQFIFSTSELITVSNSFHQRHISVYISGISEIKIRNETQCVSMTRMLSSLKAAF